MALSEVTWAHRAYRTVARAMALPLLGWLWWRGVREPLYRQRLGERLGRVEVNPSSLGCIWVHAASVGEVQASQPLLQALLQEWPDHTVVVSTQTPTGAQALHAHWGDRIRHVYAPIDTPAAVRRSLARLQPRLLVLVERELWPEWLHQCRARSVPVVLVNARLSERTVRGYRQWRALMQPMWRDLHVSAADAPSAERFAALGVAAAQITLTGNLKFDVVPPAPMRDLPTELAGRVLVVAGSTHALDETAWLDAWRDLCANHPERLLVLVPRHPQRFDEAAREVARRGFALARRSTGAAVDASTQVLLVDAMGELLHWYRHAALCFVGGTLAPVGGHNPLEPMSVGQPVLFGPHTQNAASLFNDIAAAGAGQCVHDTTELAQTAREWLDEPDARRVRANAARALMATHRGATERTLSVLRPLLGTVDAAALQLVQARRVNGHTLWFDPQRLPDASPGTFDAQSHAGGAALATGSGRGQALRIGQGDRGGPGLVLRHYRRGGLMARLSRDRFWRAAPVNSRAMREFALLRLMRSWRLPVPEPVAALHRPRGLFYQADIVVGLIPESQNVVQLLQQRALSAAEWSTLGSAIRQMHDRQVFHSDLNAHNLMLDSHGRAWIVDFDKCGVRPGEAWKQANLDRLLRSLRKEATRVQPFHWDEAQWSGLLAGHARLSAHT